MLLALIRVSSLCAHIRYSAELRMIVLRCGVTHRWVIDAYAACIGASALLGRAKGVSCAHGRRHA